MNATMPLSHELLGASAGTGKTYQLTNRYLRLLFLTGEPERIIALTFTRKAAGEFFGKIFQRLADGAATSEGAQKLSREIDVRVDMPACRAQLRRLLDRLHRLQLSTYDSFFSRIVQTFPFELGLAGPPKLLDGAEQVLAIQRAQDALSRRTQIDEAFFKEFWYACRRATMGAETKTISEVLSGFVQRNHALYFEAPEAHQWGDCTTLWGGCCPWECETVDLAAAARDLQESLPWASLLPRQQEFWREYLAVLPEWRPPAELPTRLKYFLEAFLSAYNQLETGAAVITVGGKPQTLSHEVGAIAKRLTRYCCWSFFQPRLEATRGVYDLVRLFEEVYSTEVRQAGRITLADATRLLASGPHGHGLADPELRALLGYRLDGWYDHWLLDEFQDTSHTQWAAIADLIDEIIQDGEGRRSFFAVGDIKQSIYRWRGSDDRLFGRVAARYASALELRSMAQSYRSAPAVLEMVNAVLGDSAAIEGVAGTAVAQRWASIWQEHESAPPRQVESGCGCLVHAPKTDEHCFETVLALLRAVRPLERGLSAAVLTRENATAEALVDYLRAHGGPTCSLAANVKAGRDSVVAAGLRSLAAVAAHPADDQAWAHLQMSPMGPEIGERLGTPAMLSAHLRDIWAGSGLTGLVDEWIRLCSEHLDVTDTFNVRRLEACRRVALELDQTGESDIDAFVDALDRLEVREHDVPGQVAVMTIHKAKGLDWDLVILTDLAGKTLSERPKGQFEVQRDENGQIEWICDLPPSTLAQHDSVLGARLEESRQDAAFERLCALYVGLTRAKRGLFVVTHPMSGHSPNYHRLLDTALGAEPKERRIGGETFVCAWSSGDVEWFQHEAPRAERTGVAEEPQLLEPEERRTGESPQPVRPSGGKPELGRKLFTETSGGGRTFGSRVHEILARVEWLTGLELADAAVIDAWVEGQPPEVAAAVRAVLTSPSTQPFFVESRPRMEVWREMPFECIQGDAWITGRFDRVLLEREADGRPAAALLVDFKTTGPTGRLDPTSYEPQLARYRDVLSTLCRLPIERVSASVVIIPGAGSGREIEVRRVLGGNFETRATSPKKPRRVRP